MARGRRARSNDAEDGRGPEVALVSDPGERQEIIRSTVRDVNQLEAERREIGERIRIIKVTRIKGQLGMKIGDFNAGFRAYALEGSDRNGFLAAQREVFESLGVGEMVDWVTEVERAEQRASDEAQRAHGMSL
jgi:hypothetical protein